MKTIELLGKIEISCIKDFETGKNKLMVVLDDPNETKQCFFIEEIVFGGIVEIVPHKY